MVEEYTIEWTKRSLQQLSKLHAYINQDSSQNADKVVDDILTKIDKVLKSPEICSPDKYRFNNDGTYRAFEKHKYRITYRANKGIVRILRIRHTKMKPLFY